MAKNGLILLAIGGAALWFLTRKGGGEVVEPPVAGPGSALVKGSLGVATVGQEAVMGMHLVQKTPGSLVTVTVPWLGQTTNPVGAAILWPYRVVFRIGHNTALGWRRIDQLFSGLTGEWYSPSVDGLSLIGPRSESKSFIMPDDPNQQWDVRITLEGKVSDASGNPTASWQVLATGEHVQAIKTISALAVVKGSLGVISVAQRKVGRMGL